MKPVREKFLFYDLNSSQVLKWHIVKHVQISSIFYFSEIACSWLLSDWKWAKVEYSKLPQDALHQKSQHQTPDDLYHLQWDIWIAGYQRGPQERSIRDHEVGVRPNIPKWVGRTVIQNVHKVHRFPEGTSKNIVQDRAPNWLQPFHMSKMYVGWSCFQAAAM